MRTFYTIDDLYEFCKINNFTKFSSKDNNGPLVVQSIGTFETINENKNGLLPVKLKSCHIGLNRNGSSISEESMKKHMNSFKGRPILGAIYETDTGEYEFRSHDMEISEDGEIEYIEQPVGVISEIEDPYLEYDEKEDKTYLMVSGNIFEDYSRAAEILQRRKTCKCSVEIAIDEMSWNALENYLSIDAFTFRGVTILGYEQDGKTEIQEGMKGSKITIDSFGVSNSMFDTNYKDKLIEVLDKLNVTLSTFSNNTNQEGGGSTMNKFEQLLEQYGKTQEDITFDVEGLSDEELEVKFKEAFEKSGEPEVEEQPQTEEKFTKVFSVEVSHEDVKFALYNLISQYDEADNDWYSIRNVYDNYFYMQGWINGKIYKQNYSINEANVSLEGERQEMFEIIVSESEKIAIDQMRNNYSVLEAQYNELKAFKDEYDAAKIKSQKDEIFGKEEYECLKETDGFKQLVEDADKYSVEEISVKADLLFAAYIKSTGEFSMKKQEVKPIAMTFGVTTVDESNKKPYGNLFDD